MACAEYTSPKKSFYTACISAAWNPSENYLCVVTGAEIKVVELKLGVTPKDVAMETPQRALRLSDHDWVAFAQ